MLTGNESRPAGNGAAIKKQKAGGRSTGVESTDVAALVQRADYALLVLSGLRNGGTRRNVYFSLPSAQAALDRAARRGVPASLTLVRFTPSGHVRLDELPEAVAR